MNQQPDIFFRKKLQGYQKPMPADAWNKVEINLDKKNNKGLWLKVAASISIILFATGLLWIGSSSENNLSKNSVSQHQANNTVAKKKIIGVTDTLLSKTIQEAKPGVTIKNKLNPMRMHNSKVEVHNHITKVKQKASNEGSQIASIKEQLTELPPNQAILPDTLDKNINLSYAETNTLTNQSVASPVTLIYTVDEVREKYLDKNKIEEATLANNNPSTLKKLLNKVYDLKNNQDPLGELRQKKDEILALNFKKRTEN